MPRIAAIDAGSNALRLLIAEPLPQGGIKRTACLREVTRLGHRVFQTGLITEKSATRSLEVLARYAELITEHEASPVIAAGTAALRAARNARNFIECAYNDTGIHIEILPPLKEAELTALGAASALLDSSDSIIFDIGGGSTELMYISRGKLKESVSLPLGVIGLKEKHISSDSPSKYEHEALLSEITMRLNEGLKEIQGHIDKKSALVGTSGTAVTLASMDLGLKAYEHDKIHGHRITLDALRRVTKTLSTMTLEEKRALKGLDPDRADIILPGALFTLVLLEKLGREEFTVSAAGLPEGLVLQRMQAAS